MMHDRLHALAVFCHSFRRRSTIVEIIADAIARENFRCHQPRADMAAAVTQDKFVKPRFVWPGPIFRRQNQDRFPRKTFRSTENERMNTATIDHLHVRQLSGLLFNDDGGEGTADDRHSED